MDRDNLPDEVMADLLESPGTGETMLTSWSHHDLIGSPAITLGRGVLDDLSPPEVNARTVRRMGESQEQADYLVTGKLGEGGMGTVFKAEQVYFGRSVALKMIKPALAPNPQAVKAFFHEAVITSRMEHPGVIPVLDFGVSQDGRALYAMMKASGTPWHRIIRNKTLSENLAIFDRVAEVIAYAHHRGIVHRDIKPANVLLGEHGEVWLGDWGVALTRSTDGSYSHAGSAGTPQYMAPEMARCEVGLIGPTSDIYLLGAVLFEVITGKPPHDGGTAREALWNSAQNTIHLTDQTNGILQLAYKAMADLPEHRYASADDLRNAVAERLKLNESVYRQQQADTHYSAARKTGEYELFRKAIASYDDALALSPDNIGAQSNRAKAILEHSKTALSRGEYELAASILQQLIGNRQATELLKNIEKKKKKAGTRKRNSRAAALAGVLILLLAMGLAGWYYHYVRGKFSETRQQALEERLVQDEHYLVQELGMTVERVKMESVLYIDSFRLAPPASKYEKNGVAIGTIRRNIYPDSVLRLSHLMEEAWKGYTLPSGTDLVAYHKFCRKLIPIRDDLAEIQAALVSDAEKLPPDTARKIQGLSVQVSRLLGFIDAYRRKYLDT